MILRLQQAKKMIQLLKTTSLILCISFNVFACQNKKVTNTMNEENIKTQPADTGRLLSIANLELTDSSRKVVAWFFETPQVFELNLNSEKEQHLYKLLKEAKEKQLPVNVHSIAIRDKNIIDSVMPATAAQINEFNKMRSQRQQPVPVPPPPHN
jgi:alpha-tubulin suppressor-like RCC1 family protein